MTTEPTTNPPVASPSPEASTVQAGAPIAAVPVSRTGAITPRQLPEKQPLSLRTLLLGLGVAVAVPVLFLLALAAFMVATNYNFLNWLE